MYDLSSIVSCYHVTGALQRLESVTAVRMIAMLQNQDLHKTVWQSTKFVDDFLDRRLLSYFYHQNAWGYGKKVKKQSQLVTEPSGGSLERAVNRYSRQKRAYENHMKTWRANASYEFLFDPPDLKNYAIAS